jgi:hypothetical protein
MGVVRDPNKVNKQGTKYVGNLAGAIQKANQMHHNRSYQGRLESAAKKQNVTTNLLEGNRDTLLKSAKQNKLGSSGLNKLAESNRQLGFNETTGMGPIESVKYQATRPEMKRDIKKTIANVRKLPTLTNVLLKALGGDNDNQLLD